MDPAEGPSVAATLYDCVSVAGYGCQHRRYRPAHPNRGRVEPRRNDDRRIARAKKSAAPRSRGGYSAAGGDARELPSKRTGAVRIPRRQSTSANLIPRTAGARVAGSGLQAAVDRRKTARQSRHRPQSPQGDVQEDRDALAGGAHGHAALCPRRSLTSRLSPDPSPAFSRSTVAMCEWRASRFAVFYHGPGWRSRNMALYAFDGTWNAAK